MKYRYTVQQLKKMEQCRYLTDRERRVFNLVCRPCENAPVHDVKAKQNTPAFRRGCFLTYRGSWRWWCR